MSVANVRQVDSHKGSNVDIRGLFTSKESFSQHQEQSVTKSTPMVTGGGKLIVDLPPADERLKDTNFGVFFNR
jgi:hypothetical protein